MTRVLEPRFKNPNPKIEKLNGVYVALVVVIVFTLPMYFELEPIFTYLGFLVYIVVAAVILKLTICTKFEADWAKDTSKRCFKCTQKLWKANHRLISC